MPLLLPFKRAGIHERVFQAIIYPVTVVLALMVLVPFSMMLALSFGDVSDSKAGRKWPDLRHWTDKDRLYIHYLATRYDYWVAICGFEDYYRIEVPGDDPTILEMQKVPPLEGKWRTMAGDALDFLKSRVTWTHSGMLFSGWFYWDGGRRHALSAYTGLGDIAWKKHLQGKYPDISALNAIFETEFASYAYIKTPGVSEPNSREGMAESDPWRNEFSAFIDRDLKPEWRLLYLGDGWYRKHLKGLPEVEGDIRRLNAIAGTNYASWLDIRLPERVPEGKAQRTLWERYVREVLNPYWLELQVTPDLEAAFLRFLIERHGSEQVVRLVYNTSAGVALRPNAREIGGAGQELADWDAFVRTVPLESLRIRTGEGMWTEFLAGKFGSVDALNEAYGTNYSTFAEAVWPQPAIDRLDWERNRYRYLGEIFFKNYRRVWDLMTDAAPALYNTLRFAALFTLLVLLVDTAAAYTMSRFRFGAVQMSLVLFLALAAFPLEAIAVPNFLLLKGMGLLNTVWALVLPTVVNGYYIYLLKAHFDSVSRSHIEDGIMHGANEWYMFWHISLPVARPMMAVVALYAFLWSYSNFIWALIVCQQRTEWTIPVLMFNMNNWSPAPMLAAAQIITIIPPLFVFVFANRTLQRGLSVPR